MPNNFSAQDSAMGYLYQARFALYVLLREKLETELSIELFDDVALEENGTPAELLQLKHHVRRIGSLQDGSSDLWKTIRVWCQALREGTIRLPGVVLTLITTSTVSEGSIASYLCCDERRNPEKARDEMVSYIQTSTNRSNQAAYECFTALSKPEQTSLIQAIRIIHSSPNILETEELIKDRIKIAVRPEHLEPFYERVEGWWFNWVIRHLSNDSHHRITGYEVHTQIHSIAEQFRADTLPIDYILDQPDYIDSVNDTRLFVQQLRLIALNNQRIEFAIRDYHRAFMQRSRWVGDQLVSISELEQYEQRLIEEWERYFAYVNEESLDGDGEDILETRGRNTYKWMEQTAQVNIRKDCKEPYVMRGSFHILANKNPPEVGWHPEFKNRLVGLLQQQEVST